MPSKKTIGKACTQAQFEAFETARTKAGLTYSQAVDAAYCMFVEAQGVEWPATGKHGGDRKSDKAKKRD